ncbi:MAG TPA: RNA polymerase sigma factor [Paenibacillus sp.]|jgi:RNA polymerase sigma-70 factor (ECF subfamily)
MAEKNREIDIKESVDQLLIKMFNEQLLETELSELYQMLRVDYYPFIVWKLQCVYDAEDAFQDWIYALYQARSLRMPDNPAAYAVKMLKNIISQYVKKKNKQANLDSALKEIAVTIGTEGGTYIGYDTMNITVSLSADIFHDELQELLYKLSIIERQYLILNVIWSYTSREIADAFNDTVAAVTKRIQRAKKKMKGYIQNLNVDGV